MGSSAGGSPKPQRDKRCVEQRVAGRQKAVPFRRVAHAAERLDRLLILAEVKVGIAEIPEV